jgi:phage terminase small subunit
MDSSKFEAPAHLSDRAKKLWESLVPERARSVGRLALLQAGLEAMDRADQCRVVLAGSSLTTTTATTKAVHLNPVLKAEREARQQFSRIWSDLGLVWDQQCDGVNFEHWKRQQERSK